MKTVFGLYHGYGFGAPEAANAAANEARADELASCKVGRVLAVDHPAGDPTEVYDFFLMLRSRGIRCGVAPASSGDWRAGPREAIARYQAVSYLDGLACDAYLHHEVHEVMTGAARARNAAIIKTVMPQTAVRAHWGGAGLFLPEQRRHITHPNGGYWQEYQYGRGEPEVLHVQVAADLSTSVDAMRSDIRRSVQRVLAVVDNARAPRPRLMTHINVADTDAASKIVAALEECRDSGIETVLLRAVDPDLVKVYPTHQVCLDSIQMAAS